MFEESAVLQQLRGIHAYCGEDDWDSYGSIAVTWAACEAALSYYECLQERYGDVSSYWCCPIGIGGIEVYFTRSSDEHPWEYTVAFEADGSLEIDADTSACWVHLDDNEDGFWGRHVDPYTFEPLTTIEHSCRIYINKYYYKRLVEGEK
jgi:hypothetical protein